MGPFHHPVIVETLVSVVWSLKTKLHSGLDHTNRNLDKMIAFTVVVARWALDVFQSGKEVAFEVSRYRVTYDSVLACVRGLRLAGADLQQQSAYNDLVDDMFSRGEELLSFASRTIA